MFKELHRNMKTCVTFNGQLPGKIWCKRRCHPASTLFSIFFAMLLTHTFKECDQGVLLRFRIFTKVFNLRRFNTKSEIFVELTRELRHGDHAVFFAHRQTFIKRILDHFSRAYNTFGLNISLKKTKVILPLVNLLLSLILK